MIPFSCDVFARNVLHECFPGRGGLALPCVVLDDIGELFWCEVIFLDVDC